MTGGLLLVASLVGLGLGAVLGATALGLRDGMDWVLGALVLVCVEATLLTIVVGAILDAYEPWALLVGTTAWATALAALCATRAVSWTGLRAAYGSARRAAGDLSWWQRLVVAVAAAALAWRVVLAVVLPPFAFDAIVYHLTIVADWVQSGRVEANHYVTCCSHYPSTAETLFAWPALFLDSDVLVDAVQIPLALVAGGAVSGLARWMGLGPGAALTAGALFLLTPIVLTQANTPYNDVALAAFLLAAAYFVVRLLDARCFALGRGLAASPSLALALVGGSATGLALGTKTSGIVITLVLTAVVLVHVLVAARRRRELRRRLFTAAAVFAASTLVVGGWWYGRNWVETGNPTWPFAVSPGGVEVFDGPETIDEYLTVPPGEERSWPIQIARSWYHDLVFWRRHDYSYEERDGGLGPLWGWFGWAAVVLLVVEAVRRRHDVAVNLVAPLLLLYLVLPYKWWSRFTIYLAALAAIAIVALIGRIRPGRAATAVPVVVLVLAFAGAARATWILDPAGRGEKLTVRDIVDLAVHPSKPRTVGDLFYPEYGFLRQIPETASVAVESEAPSIRFPYPFFGDGLDRSVTLLHDGDERRLAAVLAGARAEYVAVGAGSRFDAWLRARPARYVRVFDERDVRLYRMTAA